MDRSTLDSLIWDLRVPMLRLAASILHHPQNAEDAVSAAILSAYRRMDTLRDDASLKPWVMKITANCCYDLLRRQKREAQYIQQAMDSADLFTAAKEDSLFDLLHQLPGPVEQVLSLYYYDHFSTAEIAHILGIPGAAVRMRMTRGRRMLRQLLEEEADETARI